MKREVIELESGQPLIEFKGVTKTYKTGTHALEDVNIKIYKGEFVFVVGASGAGKSTFIKMIMHEESPNTGEVVVNGYKMSKIRRRDVPYLRRTMGIVFQDFRIIPTMNVFDNVAFTLRVVGMSSREIRKKVAHALALVGLGEKARAYPRELSGGEQQRVGLARALVNNPSLIIADEPTGNVDPNMSYEIVELLTEINRRGTTVVMVTHEHQLVRDFNRRVIMLEKGTVVADNAESAEPVENESGEQADGEILYDTIPAEALARTVAKAVQDNEAKEDEPEQEQKAEAEPESEEPEGAAKEDTDED
jgi:cell division transport system ATP-binding protein